MKKARGQVAASDPMRVALTKEQMAAALQVSVRFLEGMMSRGEIEYFKIGRKVVRFRIEDAMKRMNETVLVKADFTEGNKENEGGTEQ